MVLCPAAVCAGHWLGRLCWFKMLTCSCYRIYYVFPLLNCFHSHLHQHQLGTMVALYICLPSGEWMYMGHQLLQADPWNYTLHKWDFEITWTKVNNMIVGLVKLYLSGSLKQKYQVHNTAAYLFKVLKDEYSTLWISGTLALFKELLDTRIAQPSHSPPSFNKVVTLFSSFSSARYKFPDNIQAMVLLAKLPSSMAMIVQMIAQAKDTSRKAKTMKQIWQSAILSWDQHHMKMQDARIMQLYIMSVILLHVCFIIQFSFYAHGFKYAQIFSVCHQRSNGSPDEIGSKWYLWDHHL